MEYVQPNPIEEPPSFLERVLGQFAGAAGYATRSLLSAGAAAARGQWNKAGTYAVDALENGAQFGTDLATFGWLVPYSNPLRWATKKGELVNPFSFDADFSGLTTRDERPEFTDVMRRAGYGGYAPRRGSFKEFGVNLAGGILTDPLTLLTLGGGGLAEGAAAGLGGTGKVAAVAEGRVLEALGRTTAGRAALAAGKTPQQLVLEAARGPEAMRAAQETFSRALAEAVTDGLPEGLQRGVMEATQHAAQRTGLELGQDGVVQVARLTGDDWQRAMVDAGIRGLENQGLLVPHYGLRLKIPFGPDIPLIHDIWPKIGNLTAPGLARKALHRYAPELGQSIDDTVYHSYSELRRLIVDKEWSGVVPESLRQVAHAIATNVDAVRKTDAVEWVRETFKDVGLEEQKLAGETAIKAFDRIRGAGAEGVRLEARKALERRLEPLRDAYKEADKALRDARKAMERAGSPAEAEWARQAMAEAQRALRRADAGSPRAIAQAYERAIAEGVNGVVDGPGQRALARRRDALAEASRTLSEARRSLERADTPATRRAAGQALERALAARTTAAGELKAALREGNARLPNPGSFRVDPTLDDMTRELFGGDVQAARTAAQLGQALMPHLDEGSAAGYAWARAEVAGQLAARGLKVEPTLRALDAWTLKAKGMADELVELGLWDKVTAKAFYIPHQANDLLAAFLQAGNPAKTKGSISYARALGDVFTQARGNSLLELTQKLTKVANDWGLPVPDLADLNMSQAVGEVLETDLASLALRRLWAHSGTVAKATFMQEAKKLGAPLAYPTAIDHYVASAFEHLGPRQGLIEKILGGGKWTLPEGALADVARLVTKAGREAAGGYQFDLPGINSIYKPAMLLTRLPFYSRNGVSNIATAGFHPGMSSPDLAIGYMTAAYSVVRDSKIMRAIGLKLPPREHSTFLKASLGQKLDAAEEALLRATKIGPHSASDVIAAAKGTVLPNHAWAEREVFDSIRDIPTAVDVLKRMDEGVFAPWYRTLPDIWNGRIPTSSLPERWLEYYRTMFRPLGRINDALEANGRYAAYLTLARKGRSLDDAAATVSKHFVDYRYQSTWDRWVRDVIPFWRYTAGSTPVTLEHLARNPGSPLNAVFRQAVAQQSETAGLPPHLRQQLAIPLGPDREGKRSYVTSFGLPYEPAFGLLEAVPGAGDGPFTGLRKQAAGMPPAVRAPLEHATGRSLYTGRDVHDAREAPSWAPWAREIQQPDGTVRREVPWWVNHYAIGALPWGPFLGWVDKGLQSDDALVNRILNTTLGVKVRTIDERREAIAAMKRYLEEHAQAGRLGKVEEFYTRGSEPDPELVQALQQLRELKAAAKARY